MKASIKRALLGVVVFSAAINLLMLAVPLYMLQLYDRVLSTRNLDTLIVLTAMAGGAVLILAALDVVRSRVMTRVGSWLESQLSGDALGAALALAQARAGLPSAQSVRDLTQLRGYIGGSSVFPLLDAPWVPIFLAVVFLMHPTLGWIAVGGTLLLVVFALINEWAVRRPLQQAGEIGARSLNEADALVRNADAVAAMGMRQALTRSWEKDSEHSDQVQRKASDRSSVLHGAAKFVRLGLQIAILGTGAYYVTIGQITGGVMIAASIIMARAVAPVEQLIPAWRALVRAQSTYKRLTVALSLVSDDMLSTKLRRPKGEVTAERLTLRTLNTQDMILRSVSFALPARETLCIVGPSGAGKTTLARLVVGSLTPTDGHVRLDGIDVSRWPPEDRGRYVGYLPQDVELFNGTVRDNISRFKEASDEEVLGAAQLAGAYDVITRLPQAFDTLIGDVGVPLSGGQRQRVALARAVFRNPSLVVLDEPNSNLDTEGERALLECLQRLRDAGTTVILVAQSPRLMRHADKLLLLSKGAIEALGPRDEVFGHLQKLGVYRPAMVKQINKAQATERVI